MCNLRPQIILAVADAIENHDIAWLGFNMLSYCCTASAKCPDWTGQNLPTVADIGGWTMALFTQHGARRLRDMTRSELDGLSWNINVVEYVASAFGISEDDAMRVLAPDTFETFTLAREKLTAAQAVRMLRDLAEFGTVDWKIEREAA